MSYEWRYSAVWRPGEGKEYLWVVSDVDSFKQKDDEYFAKGFRIAAIDRHWEHHVAVWHPGTGEQHWWSGIDSDEFKTKDAEYFAKGLRLVALDTDGGDFLGVWRSGSGGQHWQSGMSLQHFHDLDNYYFAKGYRLAAIDIDHDGYVAAVWRPGTGAQHWWYGNSYDDFKVNDSQQSAKGMRLELFDRRETHWMGVWKSGPGPYHWWTGITMDEFTQKETGYISQGLRLCAVDLIRIVVQPPPEKVEKALVLRIYIPSVVGVDSAFFTLSGPDGTAFSQAADNLTHTQGVLKLSSGYNPVGPWQVRCQMIFHAPTEQNVNIDNTFTNSWASGNSATFTYSLEHYIPEGGLGWQWVLVKV